MLLNMFKQLMHVNDNGSVQVVHIQLLTHLETKHELIESTSPHGVLSRLARPVARL